MVTPLLDGVVPVEDAMRPVSDSIPSGVHGGVIHDEADERFRDDRYIRGQFTYE